MANEPRWLAIDAVIACNQEEVAKSGEPHELRDRAALQIALAHPWNKFVYFMDADIAMLAATLFSSVANAKAFAAGNKRTALRAAVAFVEANGYDLDAPDYAIDKAFAYFDYRLSQTGLVEWFRLWMTAR